MKYKLPEHIERKIRHTQNCHKLNPGVHTELIKDRPAYVEKKVNAFYAEMQAMYPTFEVISTNSTAYPAGVCFYITYKI